jgi:hypothetical protein
MDAFKAAFSDDSSKVEEIARAAQAARESTDDKPDEVEETEQEPATTSVAKVDETPPEKEEAQEPQARNESGKFVKTVPHEALHAERRKREERETELAQARAELERLRASQPVKPPTSFYEDEEQAWKDRIAPLEAKLAEKDRRLFDVTVEIARDKPGREDYDEIAKWVQERGEIDPTLPHRIVNSANPGEMLYRLGKAERALVAAGGDVTKLTEQAEEKYRERLTDAQARIKALEAEVAQARNSKQQREAIPQSLNSEQSASQKDEVFKGPTPLRDILPKI